jgi:WD40 repeat protein
MTTPHQDTFCPYKGLQPYTEADRKYFFGRSRDQGIISSNLFAASVTVFYGASGVGKSSVLLAGVVPRLREEPRTSVVVVFNNWQAEDFRETLKAKIAHEAGVGTVDVALPLDEFLAQTQRAAALPMLIIFDQFEEYFLYHPPSPNADAFEAAFARAVNRRDVRVNFLLSLREDGLSKLDRFQGRIPTLLNNLLRLEHLDRKAAEEAITKPLDEYNAEVSSGQPPVTIEPALVTAVLDDLATAKVMPELAGQGRLDESQRGAVIPIETPFMQMVLTRLWDQERANGSHELRLKTYEELGRAINIARTHLDNMMAKLSGPQLDTAAKLLRYLVTPTGSKIAQESSALASWSEVSEAEVQEFLTRLTAPDMRILKTVQTPGQPVRYEIFHDVLAPAILDWRGRYAQQQKVQEEVELARKQAVEARKRARARLLPIIIGSLLVLLLVMTFLAFKAYQARFIARSTSLAVYSRTQQEMDPELSLLLAMEAVRHLNTPESLTALKEALMKANLAAVLTPEIMGKERRISAVAFSSDGQYLVTAGWDSYARVWDVVSGKMMNRLAGAKGQLTSTSFSPDDKYVLTAGQDMTVRVWENWKTGAPAIVKSFNEASAIETASFSPDSEYILTGGGEGKVNVWEWKADPPRIKAELHIGSALVEARSSYETPAAAEASSATPVDPNNPSLANGVMASPTPTPTPGKVKVFNAEFSRDGKSIIIAPNRSIGLVWYWTEGPKVAQLKGHSRVIYGVAFSSDGHYAVSGSDDATAVVWDLWRSSGPSDVARLSLVPNQIRGVAFSRDGRFVATASYDRLGRIWNWKSWQAGSKPEARVPPVILRPHKGLVICVAFSPDGQWVVTGSDDGSARVWRTEQLDRSTLDSRSRDELLELAGQRVTRQLTGQERELYRVRE